MQPHQTPLHETDNLCKHLLRYENLPLASLGRHQGRHGRSASSAAPREEARLAVRAASVRQPVSCLITLIKIFTVVSFHDSSADFNKGESHLDAAAALSCQQIMMNHIPPIFVLAWPCPAPPRPNPPSSPGSRPSLSAARGHLPHTPSQTGSHGTHGNT